MAELEQILESDRAVSWTRPGVRFRPVNADDVPNDALFLNDIPATGPRLCYKNEQGTVFKVRLALL